MISLIILGIIFLYAIISYNTLTRKRNNVDNAFGSIDVMLKKRFDLIPNLVATVQQYAKHEEETFAKITNLRTKSYDSLTAEEKADFFWLQEHAPELELIATIQVKMRVLPRGASGEVLAIGQKAAYFGRSRHFVNLVQGEGLYGFDGIRRTAELMMDAYLNEKDTEKLVVQKGWGCECCL